MLVPLPVLFYVSDVVGASMLDRLAADPGAVRAGEIVQGNVTGECSKESPASHRRGARLKEGSNIP